MWHRGASSISKLGPPRSIAVYLGKQFRTSCITVMIDACFSLFLVHDASFMSAAHHCLRHLFRSFSLCFSRICFLYIDRLGASGSLGLIVNKRLDLILCLPLSPISWGFGPLVCLRAFCCLPSCILFCLGCACPFYLLSVVD